MSILGQDVEFVFSFQESLDVMSTNDDNTLGFTLELYSRYMEAARVSNVLLVALANQKYRKKQNKLIIAPRKYMHGR